MKNFENDNDAKNPSYSYYSRLLSKPYETLEALKKAEDEYRQKEEQKNSEKNARKDAAAKVEQACAALRSAKAEYIKNKKALDNEYLKNQKELAQKYTEDKENIKKDLIEKEEACTKLLNDFVKKYGSFHTTVTDGDTLISVSYDTSSNDFLDNMFKLFSDFHSIFN